MIRHKLEKYIQNTIPKVITDLQGLRNETVHVKTPAHKDVKELREKILGVGKESMLIKLVKIRVEIGKEIKMVAPNGLYIILYNTDFIGF